MNTPTPAQIRSHLHTFLGEKRYARFVRSAPRDANGTRLRYWMEEAWAKFVAAHSDCQLTYPEIVALFLDCPERKRQARILAEAATWLYGSLQTTEEIEAGKLPFELPKGVRPIPFNALDRRWVKMKSQLQPGDHWQRFRTPPETWKRKGGMAGIALVRDGRVVDFQVRKIN